MRFFDTSSLIKGATLEDGDYLSPIVLKELENIKTSSLKDEETKWLAREALRKIRNINYKVCLFSNKEREKICKKYLFLSDNNDSIILCDAILLSATFPITLYTNDLLMYYLGKNCIQEIETEFFEPVDSNKELWNGWTKFYPNEEQMVSLYTQKESNILNAKQNEYCEIYENGVMKDLFFWNGLEYTDIKYYPINEPYPNKEKNKEKINPRNLQQKMAFHLLQNKNIRVKLLLGNYGSGKAQPNTTIIPTPKGPKKLGELQVGDFVFDRSGKPTEILGIFPQGVIDNYEITFSDGRIAYCNDEHLWPCLTSKKNIKNITVKEMLQRGIKNNSGNYRFKLPSIKPVDYNYINYEIDPYVVGCFLGDGCCLEKSLTLSSQDEELVQEVSRLIKSEYIKNKGNNNWIFRLPAHQQQQFYNNLPIKNIHTKDFFAAIPEKEGILTYSYNKFIPSIYKYGSIEQRLSLLQGLLDTDGNISDIEKGRISFSSTSIKLIKDVQELCWSLGFKASISEDNRFEKYTIGHCYHLSISCLTSEKYKLFRLSRKKNIATNIHHSIYSNDNNLIIHNIKKLDTPEAMTCIYVNNTEHIYLTEQYIPTHNTYLMLAHALYFIDKGYFQKIVFIRNNIEVKNTEKLGSKAPLYSNI